MDNKNPNQLPEQFLTTMNAQTQKLMAMFDANAISSEGSLQNMDEGWPRLLNTRKNSEALLKAITDWQNCQLQLAATLLGIPIDVVSKAATKDRRFNSKDWNENPVFNYVKASYLMSSHLAQKLARRANMKPDKQKQLEFYTKQYIDALAPSNFLVTNPDAIRLAVETKGKSLMDGFKNLVTDMKKGRISMTDEAAFTLGENIAITDGAVVFENEIMQVIQYTPTTDKVAERPVLIVPPCINKFYILDLQPDNSFVKYAVDQGNTVFLVSWVNAKPEQSHLSWDDYVEMGVFEALTVAKSITGSEQVNCVSWCVGGTILATAMAVLAARNDDTVSSATFLTTFLDFEDPGEISVFLDDPKKILGDVEAAGVLDGRKLGTVFNMLRSNDLIWSYVVNSYLKGVSPPPFDILYWNSDPTNLPAAMYNYYLNNMYRNNDLKKPDRLTICGEKIDLGKITAPCYFLSTIDDHIAPWKSTFAATELIPDVKFVLGGSGHVAGVINPASRNRRNYWINGETGNGTDHWLETAENTQGSWWNNWAPWVKNYAGKQIAAPKTVGNKDYPAIEPAPGRYVMARIN